MSPRWTVRARTLSTSAPLVLSLLGAGCARPGAAPEPSRPAAARYAIVPLPRRLTPMSGELVLDRDTRIVASDGARAVAELFAVPLRAASGLPLPIGAPGGDTRHAIALVLDPAAAPAEPESYRLVVSPVGATLSARTVPGLLNGVQTMRQLLPPAAGRGLRTLDAWGKGADSAQQIALASPTPARWAMPAVEIEDAPRFRYRGILLDVGRYYFPPEFLRELVDMLALYKLNTLQLHLTDDQGWRLEIRKYPRLTTVGAWRKETQLGQHFDPYVGDGKPHGGFYTQQQMRDLVAYAAARNVTIIPEIEMPGHSGAAIAAYPELACTPGPFEVSTHWGVHEEVYCPTEKTIGFLEDVLTEVMEVFPSEYIHIGGDEVPKTRWKASPVAQDIMKREGLRTEEELQSWFTRRIERFLRSHGRKLIGWEEILQGGIAPEATVMSWLGMQGGIDAAKQGHDVVMSPGDYAYIDHYQGDPAQEPLAIGGYLPLDTVYAFEPVPPQLTPEQATHVLGLQGNLWTEYISTPEYAEYMLFPRTLALAEVGWSAKDARDWTGFVARLGPQLARLDAMAVGYRVPDPLGTWGDVKVVEDVARLTMASPVVDGVVRFTTDGSVPTTASPRYTAPFEVRVSPTPATVRARVYLPNGRTGGVATARISRAEWKPAVAVDAARLSAGLDYTYSEGTFRQADSVRQAKATRTATVREIGLRGDERPEEYALRFTGLIRVPSDALYAFHVISDDGAKLRIDDDVVVDHDGQHDATEKRGQAALRAGYHRFELLYWQGPGGAALRLDVSAPGMPRRQVPAGWFVRTEADSGKR